MLKGNAGFIILVVLALFFLLGGVFLVFYFSNANPSNNSSTPSLVASQSAVQNVASNSAGSTSSATLGEKVYFVKKDGLLYFKIGDRFYTEDGNPMPQFDPNTLVWQPLLDIPKDTTTTAFNEAFSFKSIPGSDNFFIIFRWEKELSSDRVFWEFPVYFFNSQSKKLSLLFKTDTKADSVVFGSSTYRIPRIDQISKDGNYVSFNMFQCWNCGGHTPEYLAFDVKNKASKKLGFVSDFSWLDNGQFQYKIPKEIPCPETEGMSPDKCFEDKNKVPFIKESF